MGWASQPIRVRDITEAVKSQSANISPSQKGLPAAAQRRRTP
jgi:hypothetical protein